MVNKKSSLSWKAVNEISGRKNSDKAKITAESDAERIKIWHKHFHDLLGIQPNIPGLEIKIIINNTIDVETGIFTITELTKTMHSTKNVKSCGLDEIPVEEWNIKSFKRNTSFSATKYTHKIKSIYVIVVVSYHFQRKETYV